MKKIVIIEDEYADSGNIVKGILKVFKEEEVQIYETHNKISELIISINNQESKEWLRKNNCLNFDLIIIDVSLSNSNDEKGLELFNQIYYNDMKFIIVSKYDKYAFKTEITPTISGSFINKNKNKDWLIIRPITRLVINKLKK